MGEFEKEFKMKSCLRLQGLQGCRVAKVAQESEETQQ